MTYIKFVVVSVLVLTGASQAQNILGQYSVPFNRDFLALAPLSWNALPDGSGGLFLVNLPDNSLHRFDPGGKELWNVPFSFGSLQGAITGMAVASDGVYLAGHANGALPGQTAAGSSGAFAGKAGWACRIPPNAP